MVYNDVALLERNRVEGISSLLPFTFGLTQSPSRSWAREQGSHLVMLGGLTFNHLLQLVGQQS